MRPRRYSIFSRDAYMGEKLNLLGLDSLEMADALRRLGERPSLAPPLYRSIYRRRQWDISAMTDMHESSRPRIAGLCAVIVPVIERLFLSTDGTRRYLMKLSDGEMIESVLIPSGRRWTLCLSTQVGCAVGCTFCVTAKMGLRRHMTPGEIVGQILVALNDLGSDGDGTTRLNIVLMGMGEPLHNYDNTVKALALMADERGMGISPRRITLSTSGVAPALRRLARERVVPNLAVSLNASGDAQRSSLIPINQRWNLHELLDACRAYPLPPRGYITFEYVLIEGVNDTLDDAERLAGLLRDQRAKINLIPLNGDAALNNLCTPPEDRMAAFQAVLARHRFIVRIRRPRGLDISAACGQLAARHQTH